MLPLVNPTINLFDHIDLINLFDLYIWLVFVWYLLICDAVKQLVRKIIDWIGGCLPAPSNLDALRPDSYGLELITSYLPEVVLFAMITYLIVTLAVELGRGRAKKALALESCAAAVRGLLFVSVLYATQLLGFSQSGAHLGGYFYSALGLTLTKIVITLTSAAILASSRSYLREHLRHVLEYPLVLSLAVLLLLLLVSANNLLTVFFSLAGFSLNLYVLILYDVASAPSREAALKYFYLSTMSAGLILMGVFVIYASTGYGEFGALKMYYAHSDNSTYKPFITGFALVLICVGFFFKLSAFPAHLWAVEVYEGSPTPVMAFFILPVKVAVLVVFVRMLNTAFFDCSQLWVPILIIASVGSLVWGGFAAAYERKLSRFLGYASINQIGFLLLAAAAHSDNALRALYIYLILYVLMTGGFLLVFTAVRRRDNFNLTYLSDFRGLAREEWLVSWSVAIYLFSMAGVPPLAGFFGKYLLLDAAIEQDMYLVAAIAFSVSLLGAYYYLRFIKTFWFEEPIAVKSLRCDLSDNQRAAVTAVEVVLWVGPVFFAPTLVAVKGAVCALSTTVALSFRTMMRPALAVTHHPYRLAWLTSTLINGL